MTFAHEFSTLPDHWVYPGGEVGIRVPKLATTSKVLARIQSSEDLVNLIMASRGRNEGPIQDLFVPYLPYARQDRVAVDGDPNAIHVLAELIALSRVNHVITVDAHSKEAAVAFATRGIRFTNLSLAPYVLCFLRNLDQSRPLVIVQPDQGAHDRTMEAYIAIIEALGKVPVPPVWGHMSCKKTRDPTSGKLTGFKFDFAGRRHDGQYLGALRSLPLDAQYLIVDDICDGGGTFNGIRTTVLAKFPHVALWTTHGIYSRGFSELSKNFNYLGCTDSYRFQAEAPANLTRIEL